MKPLFPFSAFLFFLLCTFWACDKEDLDWNRQKISFVQIENDPDPVETTEEIILSATIHDIEDPGLTPTPEPLVEWGHIFSTNEAAISSLPPKIADLRSLGPGINQERGQSLFSKNNTYAEQSYNTIIRVDAIRDLQTGTPYFYRAYVKRPHDGTYCLSSFSPDEFFEIPKVKIETIFPDDPIVRTEMQIKVFGKISDAKDLEIVEFGHRLFEGNNPQHIDEFFSTNLISGNLTGEYTYFHELPFFDVNQTYTVKAYIKYLENGNTEEEIDDIGQVFFFDEAGFWINTATLRKRSDPDPDVGPLALENTVSFVLTDASGIEFAYVGLGDSGGQDPVANLKFWKFDPRFYTWEEVPFPFPAELKNPVFFTHENTAFIGLGENADGSGHNTTFWQTDFTADWDPVDDMEISNFTTQLVSAYNGNGASIDPDILPSLMYRSSTFNASREAASPFFGGGKGPGFNRLANIPVDYEKKNADERLWYDFNNDHKVDWGQWVDVDGDGKINAGIEKSRVIQNGSTSTTEYWLELEDVAEEYAGRDLMPNAVGRYFLSVRGDDNSSKSVEVIPGNDLANDELFDQDQDYNSNSIIRRCEWNNHSAGGPPDNDKTVDDGQIELVEVTKYDLWVWENNSWRIHIDSSFQRYGAFTFNNGMNYIIGGVNEEGAGYGQSVALDANYVPLGDALENINLAYGIAFTINGISYFGGGEEFSGNIPSLNVMMFEPPAGIRPTVGCGLPALTRGIAFAANGKGFIGIGRERPDKLTEALWMYIPF